MTTSVTNAFANARVESGLSPRTWMILRISALLIILEATVVGRLLNHIAPSYYDSQVFAYIGLSWTAGHIPYLSLWDIKPPGIFAVNAAAFEFLPHTMKTLSVIEGLWLLLTVVVVFRLCRLVRMPALAQYSTAVCAAIAINLSHYTEGGNITEIYLLLPVVSSMYLFISQLHDLQWRRMFAAGVCTGIAMLFKPVGLAPFLAQLAFMAWLSLAQRRIPIVQASRAIAVNFLGVLVPWVIALLYFARYGAASEFVDAAMIFPIKYSAANPHHLLAEPFIVLHVLAPISVLVVAVTTGAVLYLGGKRQRQVDSQLENSWRLLLWPLMSFWIGADLAGAMLGGKNYEHYFLPLVLSLAIGSGFFLWDIHDALPARKEFFAGVLAILLVGSLCLSQVRDVGQKVRGRNRNANQLQWAQIADRIRTTERPGDSVYVWPYEPAIYFGTGLPAASRHFLAHQIYDHPAGYQVFGGQILQDLAAHPPTFVIDCVVPCVRGRGPAARQEVPALVRNGDPVYESFRAMVARDYEELISTADYRAFRRKEVRQP